MRREWKMGIGKEEEKRRDEDWDGKKGREEKDRNKRRV